MHRRSVIMVNNSERVYKFQWSKVDHVLVKPSTGYISPGEEKDIEIIFFCPHPVEIKKVSVTHKWAILYFFIIYYKITEQSEAFIV